MKNLLRIAPYQIPTRNKVPAYNPEVNEQKTRDWSNRLNGLSSSAESKVYLAQLGALINYYNRNVEDKAKVYPSLCRISIGRIGSQGL